MEACKPVGNTFSRSFGTCYCWLVVAVVVVVDVGVGEAMEIDVELGEDDVVVVVVVALLGGAFESASSFLRRCRGVATCVCLVRSC